MGNRHRSGIVKVGVRRVLLPLLTVTVVAGCGEAASSGGAVDVSVNATSDATAPVVSSSSPSVVQPVSTPPATEASQLITVQTVPSSRRVGTIPWDVGPLPPGQTLEVDLDDVLAMLQRGEFARFFETEDDLATVSITVGLITDHSNTSGGSSGDSSFAGYLVEGGHSICIPSIGEPIPCSTEILINGDTGEVPIYSELFAPQPTPTTALGPEPSPTPLIAVGTGGELVNGPPLPNLGDFTDQVSLIDALVASAGLQEQDGSDTGIRGSSICADIVRYNEPDVGTLVYEAIATLSGEVGVVFVFARPDDSREVRMYGTGDADPATGGCPLRFESAL